NVKSKIVGIGEIGLDYYWNSENKEMQKYTFIKQIELANKFNLPIIIHTREAVMDTVQILKEYPVSQKGIFHCCPLNRELVKEALKLGFFISFAGPVTFKNSKNADEIIQMVPEDKMLIETDSPYLAPEPVRGRRNDSQNVKYIAEKIAGVKKVKIEEIAEITYDNAKNIFKI
ncbi:MAG: TatD family hydrolase, partial [Clostridia bacterium]